MSPDRLGAFRPWLVSAAVLLAFPLVVNSDIRNTKHNLARSDDQKRVDAKEICVFCHAPMASDGAPSKVTAPLWQPSLKNGETFTTYSAMGTSGLEANDGIGSPSVACLSCHDASQAFSVTRDTTVDHPFGVLYRGGQPASTSKLDNASFSDEASGRAARSIVSDEFRAPSGAVIATRRIWWVSSSNSMHRGKSDLPLYARRSEGGDEGLFIECTSCHDPHSENTTFLRLTSTGSKLCMTCHIK